MKNEYLFNVQTPLDFYVHCTEEYWQQKIIIAHPVMADKVADVQRALSSPQEIRLS